ncbi:MAG: tail fiber protein [Verrucomicrobia bacterium]|nr:tail fiber protein [Verrucomicrobiota bacterium]
MASPFVAEIRIFAFNFAPRGWAFCNGQILPLSQNTALFSLLGTTYGGNGQSTFALPNLQGSAPMFWGQGPGLSLRDLGETGGLANLTLLDTQMPVHFHTMQADTVDVADTNTVSGSASLAQSSGGGLYQGAATANAFLAAQAVSPVGGSLPHNNMMPYLTLNFCIALQGVYPPRT